METLLNSHTEKRKQLCVPHLTIAVTIEC